MSTRPAAGAVSGGRARQGLRRLPTLICLAGSRMPALLFLHLELGPFRRGVCRPAEPSCEKARLSVLATTGPREARAGDGLRFLEQHRRQTSSSGDVVGIRLIDTGANLRRGRRCWGPRLFAKPFVVRGGLALGAVGDVIQRTEATHL